MNTEKMKNDLEDFKREYFKKNAEVSKLRIETDYLRDLNKLTIEKYEARINKLEKEYKNTLVKILGQIENTDCKGCDKSAMMRKIKSLFPLSL